MSERIILKIRHKNLPSMKKEMKEEWKTLPSFPDYQVSNLGSLKTLKGKILSLHKNDKGYLACRIKCIDGKYKTRQIHRLVARAFITNPCPELFNQVNHKDLDKTNNHVSNLEWTSQSRNMIHMIRNRKDYKPKVEQKIKIEDVVLIRGMKSKGMSNREIAKYFPIDYKQVSNICNGTCWKDIKTPFDAFRGIDYSPEKRTISHQQAFKFSAQ